MIPEMSKVVAKIRQIAPQEGLIRNFLRFAYRGGRKIFGQAKEAALQGVQPVTEYNLLRGEPLPHDISVRVATEVTQAGVLEENLESMIERDWRTHFSQALSGEGLEIGALQRPLPKHSNMKVRYLDRFPIEKLREHYPELKEAEFITPDFVCDTETLDLVPLASQDFIIATYVFEHLKNPLRALESWCRVLRPNGLIYFTAPDKRRGFDRSRPRTTLEHLILDYYYPSSDRDRDHYLEYALLVHHASGIGALHEADRLAQMDYCIHYHVFMPTDLLHLVRWFSDNICSLDILEGPCMSPNDEEIHMLLRVRDSAPKSGSIRHMSKQRQANTSAL